MRSTRTFFDRARGPRPAEGGYTILEVMIAMAVLVIITQAFAVFLRSASLQNNDARFKAQATEHAIQMLEELRSIVLDDNADIKVLDNYNDLRVTDTASANYGGPNYKYTLTTKTDITAPGGNQGLDYITAKNPASGNFLGPKGYTFVRHVDITHDPNDDNLRRIHVRVWRAYPNAGSGTASTALSLQKSSLPLAEVFATVRSLVTGVKPTQVLDVYLIALENVPGWWSRTSNLIPIMRACLISLQSRNPGLVIRPHWIRRLSYGRDVEYTPETNDTLATTAGALTKTYIYPGMITYDDAQDYYYLTSWFKGRIIKDGVMLNGGTNSPGNAVDGYPMADQFNHAMRYPDEERLWAIHQTVATNMGAEAPEMSLRMLQEKQLDGDPSVAQSIIINLHGEMLPVVPLRNFSDAAKDPAYYVDTRANTRAWRAVSHPEYLHYASGSNVNLRVYAYDFNTYRYATNGASTYAYEDDLVEYVTLFVPGADLSNLVSIKRMQGNSRNEYKWITSTANNTPYDTFVSGTYTAYYDSPSATSWTVLANARWYADLYQPPAAPGGSSRTAGLRIVLRGVTPTARVYNGPYIP